LGELGGLGGGEVGLLAKGDRDFPQPVTLVEGIGLGEAFG